MDPTISHQIQDAFSAAIVLGGPILAVASVIGFIFAVFQAITQIQDQTLPQVVKTAVACLMIFVLFDALSAPLVRFTSAVFVMHPVR